MTKEQRFSALAVGLFFAEFAASASDECRATLQALHLVEEREDRGKRPTRVFTPKENSPGDGKSSLLSLARKKHKMEFFQRLNSEIPQLSSFQEVLESLAPLLSSAYFEEAGAATEAFVIHCNTADLLRHSINYFKDSVSAASADFLRIVIKGSQARDIGPCMHEIVEKLTVLVQSENAVNRKSAVFCFVEMRVLIGKQFDPEIGKLPFVSRKMIQFYFEQTNVKA
jgi:hypothetical protein